MDLTQYIVDRNIPVNKFLEDADQMIDWKGFEHRLKKIIKYKQFGRPPYPISLIFRMYLIQIWYGLSDEQTEFQCKDRLSFRKFLKLNIDDNIPDATTLENFSHRLAERNFIEEIVKYKTAHRQRQKFRH